MSETQYASVVGFVQFDPETKEVNGQTILNFSVRAVGFTGQPLVQVTLWSEFSESFEDVVKGAFVAVDGKYKQNTSNGKTYHNISATKLAVVAEAYRAPREGGAAPASAGSDTQPAF